MQPQVGELWIIDLWGVDRAILVVKIHKLDIGIMSWLYEVLIGEQTQLHAAWFFDFGKKIESCT